MAVIHTALGRLVRSGYVEAKSSGPRALSDYDHREEGFAGMVTQRATPEGRAYVRHEDKWLLSACTGTHPVPTAWPTRILAGHLAGVGDQACNTRVDRLGELRGRPRSTPRRIQTAPIKRTNAQFGIATNAIGSAYPARERSIWSSEMCYKSLH